MRQAKLLCRGAAGMLAVLASTSSSVVAQTSKEKFSCFIDPKSTVELGTAEEGIISTITAKLGSQVKKGDVVVQLNTDMEEVQVRLVRRQAKNDIDIKSNRLRWRYRDQELRRVKELYRKKVVSSQKQDEAEIERGLAKFTIASARFQQELAKLELQRALKKLARRTVRSPIDGIVTEVSMEPGEYAHKQATLLRIAEMDPLHVSLFLPIKHYRKVALGMTGKIFPEAPVGGSFDAKVIVVDKVFDAASRTFGIRLELANPNFRIPAGLRCKVVLF